MNPFYLVVCIVLTFLLPFDGRGAELSGNVDVASILLAQATGRLTDRTSGSEQLKIAAVEGLISAPPERALPLLQKVLSGNNSDELKSRALFVLSQIDLPEAQTLLVGVARDASLPLRIEAIRNIGIGGAAEALATLPGIYRNGDAEIRNSVLQAYLIANDKNAVFEIAQAATTEEEFSNASRILGAMGATQELRQLRGRGGHSPGLIQAYVVAGDLQSLQEIATQSEDPGQRDEAIRGIGVIGDADTPALLMGFYRNAADETTREAALQGLMIAGHDESVLSLFRASRDPAEKRRLLRTLVHMDSKLLMEVIDATLEDTQP